MYPTADEGHNGNCSEADQQFSHILWRWAAEPFGFFDATESNHERVRTAIEFLIGPLLKRSADASLHEFWCDGVDFVGFVVNDNRFDSAVETSDSSETLVA